jgi:transposase-like protein
MSSKEAQPLPTPSSRSTDRKGAPSTIIFEEQDGLFWLRGENLKEAKTPLGLPDGIAGDGFQSKLVRRYERASASTRTLFAQLYLEGPATGDFEPVFRELVGETTALSATAIVRLKDRWADEYEAWRKRPLVDHQYAYIWADGIYLGVGTEGEKTALLTVVGATRGWEEGVARP